MNFIIFDTETTGLLLPSNAPLDAQPQIIELGAVLCDGNGVRAELSQLIDPGQPLPAEITKITGIRDEDLAGKPTFAEFLPALKLFFADADFLICHNAPFDSGMLRNELQRADCEDFPWPKEILCTAQEYAARFGRRPRMNQLYERIIGKPLAQTHRALDDARALHEILVKDGLLAKLGS